jgi:hypothetical protein
MNEQPKDYGPSVTHDEDGRLLSQGAGRVVLEDRPDPNNPQRLIRGAKRYSVIHGLYARGRINRHQYQAAMRFVDDMAIAVGQSPADSLSRLGRCRGSGERSDPSQRVLDALTRVRRVVELLQLRRDGVFWWVVVWNGGVRQYDERYGLRFGTAAKWLRDALDALDRHYASR